ncbi:Pre-mRNA-splicing factor 38 [Trypanosoma melophagium]|uniref:Pre-mRNA-splicing factor 38 n=1 Tax=Trypanosoma melophagium TaxID=715481 RepID=UPI003519E8C0|nr:Pre-mRNA-splicing factor 38 [Trypanosoma melophagium]
MGDQKRMLWNLRGRSAVGSLDPPTRHRITQSHVMVSCMHKPLLATVESLMTVHYVGGLSGPLQKPEPFICLITRLLQITPDPSIVLAMLHQDVHKYLRVAAMFVIRLIGNDTMIRETIRIGWDDYRKIRVYGYPEDWTTVKENDKERPKDDEGVMNAPSYAIMCVDEITDRLFNLGNNNKTNAEQGYTWLGIRFSPMLL